MNIQLITNFREICVGEMFASHLWARMDIYETLHMVQITCKPEQFWMYACGFISYLRPFKVLLYTISAVDVKWLDDFYCVCARACVCEYINCINSHLEAGPTQAHYLWSTSLLLQVPSNFNIYAVLLFLWQVPHSPIILYLSICGKSHPMILYGYLFLEKTPPYTSIIQMFFAEKVIRNMTKLC